MKSNIKNRHFSVVIPTANGAIRLNMRSTLVRSKTTMTWRSSSATISVRIVRVKLSSLTKIPEFAISTRASG